MSTAVSSIIARLRRQLRDVISDHYLFTDSELINYIDAAQRDIFRRRPEAAVLSTATTVSPIFNLTVLSSTGDNIGINDNFIEAIVYYCLKKACEASNVGKPDVGLINYFNQMYEQSINL